MVNVDQNAFTRIYAIYNIIMVSYFLEKLMTNTLYVEKEKSKVRFLCIQICNYLVNLWPYSVNLMPHQPGKKVVEFLQIFCSKPFHGV